MVFNAFFGFTQLKLQTCFDLSISDNQRGGIVTNKDKSLSWR